MSGERNHDVHVAGLRRRSGRCARQEANGAPHPDSPGAIRAQIRELASEDPDVVAVMHAVYRTGVQGMVLGHLINAARRGKQVTVVIELRARFEESANLGTDGELFEMNAKERAGRWAAVEGERLEDMLAEARSRSDAPAARPAIIAGTGAPPTTNA